MRFEHSGLEFEAKRVNGKVVVTLQGERVASEDVFLSRDGKYVVHGWDVIQQAWWLLKHKKESSAPTGEHAS